MPYVATRRISKLEDVRYIRSLKFESKQVANNKWKILAISVPDIIYDANDLLELKKVAYSKNNLVTFWSGTIWHALLGKKGTPLYNGIEEHLVQRGVTRWTELCDADGMLIDQDRPWQAVIISIFKTGIHELNNQEGPVLIPLNLSPSRYLFLREEGVCLPFEIIKQLKVVLCIN
jgi:hypothetical protein